MNIYEYLDRPLPFHRGELNFWDDPHISEQLLNAHLDPDFEGASRKPGFIDESVEWITRVVEPAQYTDVLDIGCGPGLYAERLHDKGYTVTGIDFSRRSSEYATARASETGRSISYRYANYLDMDFNESFDLALMIYCDFGALSLGEGERLLSRIHQSLRPGGKLLLDVFTFAKLTLFKEKRSWEHHASGGFWRPDAHFTIQADCIYPDHTTLEQTVVVSRNAIQAYYIWHRYFTPEALTDELKRAGFVNPLFYGDVAGRAWSTGSETLAVVVENMRHI